MVKLEHLAKLKKFFSSGGEGMNLAQSLLCAVALGEKLSPIINNNRKTQQIFHGLRRYRFVRHVRVEGKEKYIITPKGENKLREILIDEVVIKNSKKWDGKWRLVMYDLPIRLKLKDLGFFQFQKSAWIYPYPCEGEILFVADFYGVRKHIEILEVSKVLDETKLKVHFGL